MAAKDDFQKSLAEKLVKVGKENIDKTSVDDAMENLASAFTDPVGEYIEQKTISEAVGIKSSDGSVKITPMEEEGKKFSDLSVQDAILQETIERQIADEEILNHIVPQVQSDFEETNSQLVSFIKNKPTAISNAEIMALEE